MLDIRKNLLDSKLAKVWRQRGTTALILVLLLAGCVANEDQDDLDNEVFELSGSGDGQESISEDDIKIQPDTEEVITPPTLIGNLPQLDGERYIGSVAWSEPAILDIENGQRMLYRADDGDEIIHVAVSEDVVYAILRIPHSQDNLYKLIAIDRKENTDAQTLEERFPVRELDDLSDERNIRIGYLNDTLYFSRSARDGDGWRKEVFVYEQQEDGSYQRTKDEFCRILEALLEDGYDFCISFSECLRCLNEGNTLLMWNSDTSMVYSFAPGGSLIGEYSVDPSIAYFSKTDGRYLVGSGAGAYYIYDLEGTDNAAVGRIEKGDTGILAVEDGYIYFYRFTWYTSFVDDLHYCVYQYNPADGEETLLYESEAAPGQPWFGNGVKGFSIQDSYCYCIDFEDGGLWWFARNLSNEDHTAVRLEQVENYHGIFDMASVEYDHKIYTCDLCGAEMFESYYEPIRLFESIPQAEKLNAYFRQKAADWTASMEHMVQERYGDYIGPDADGICDYHYFTEVFAMGIEGITQYVLEYEQDGERLSCLEVDYREYTYGGFPRDAYYKVRYFFDLEDGSEIDIADIYRISKEELCRLAAEYTVEDYKENSDLYRGNYDSDEDFIYEMLHDYYLDTRCTLRLGAEGIIVEYGPNTLGYNGGWDCFIEVTIPYEEFGIRLIEINGVNE